MHSAYLINRHKLSRSKWKFGPVLQKRCSLLVFTQYILDLSKSMTACQVVQYSNKSSENLRYNIVLSILLLFTTDVKILRTQYSLMPDWKERQYFFWRCLGMHQLGLNNGEAYPHVRTTQYTISIVKWFYVKSSQKTRIDTISIAC